MTDIPSWNPSQTARDKGPKRTTPPPKKERAARAKPTGFLLSFDQLEEGIKEFLEFVGGALLMKEGTRRDGVVIIGAAEELAESYRKLAERNPYVRKFLDKAMSGKSALEVFIPTLAVLMAIGSNHGLPIPFQPVPFETYEKKFAANALAEMEDADLTPQERAVMNMMFGMTAANPMDNGDAN